jgi:hypothetical protein
MAISAVLVTGCTMIPKYTRPDAPVPAAWPSGPAYKETPSTQAASAAGDLQWRQLFTDAACKQIIETALKNNRDLRVAALNVETGPGALSHPARRAVAHGGNRDHRQQAARQDFRRHRFGDRGGIQRQSWASVPGRLISSAVSAACQKGPWRNTSPRNRPAAAPRSCWCPKWPTLI